MLNGRKQRFIEEYLIDCNATQAAIRAGYSAKTAYSAGQRLLKNVEVGAAVQAARDELSRRLEITAERVLQAYAQIAFANMLDYLRWGPDGVRLIDSDALTDDQAAAVAEVTTTTKQGGSVRLKLHDKVRALDALAKHLKLTPEALRVSGNVSLDLSVLSDDELRQLLAITERIHREAPRPGTGAIG